MSKLGYGLQLTHKARMTQKMLCCLDGKNISSVSDGKAFCFMTRRPDESLLIAIVSALKASYFIVHINAIQHVVEIFFKVFEVIFYAVFK